MFNSEFKFSDDSAADKSESHEHNHDECQHEQNIDPNRREPTVEEGKAAGMIGGALVTFARVYGTSSLFSLVRATLMIIEALLERGDIHE